VLEADRDKVEQEADEILDSAEKEDTAFLVVGDPFGYILFFETDRFHLY
jgi:diphthine synthase